MPIEGVFIVIVSAVILIAISLAGSNHEKLIKKARSGVWIPREDVELILTSLRLERERWTVFDTQYADDRVKQIDELRDNLIEALQS